MLQKKHINMTHKSPSCAFFENLEICQCLIKKAKSIFVVESSKRVVYSLVSQIAPIYHDMAPIDNVGAVFGTSLLLAVVCGCQIRVVLRKEDSHKTELRA